MQKKYPAGKQTVFWYVATLYKMHIYVSNLGLSIIFLKKHKKASVIIIQWTEAHISQQIY